MSTQTLKYPTLAEALWLSLAGGSRSAGSASLQALAMPYGLLRWALLAVGGTALLALSAKIQIPFWPVPLTMQTFAVLGLGFAYGWKLGGFTMLLYLAAGALGLPLFAGKLEESGGLAPILGPAGGYLFGFIAAAAFCGWLAERGWDRRPLTTFAAMLLGNIIIYCFGLPWLGWVIGWDKPILQLGLYPFVLGDLLKIFLAVAILPTVWLMLKKWLPKEK